jgi:hypothetical protein
MLKYITWNKKALLKTDELFHDLQFKTNSCVTFNESKQKKYINRQQIQYHLYFTY